MKTTLKKTLKLAKSGIITDTIQIRKISEELLNVKLSELESTTGHLAFVRNLKYSDQAYFDDPTDYFETFTLQSILSIPDQFRDNGEDKNRCIYLRNIMLALFEATSIQQVRLFNYLSLSKFIYLNPKINYDEFSNKYLEAFHCSIHPQFTIGDFFRMTKNKFMECWNIYDDINVLKDEIMTCGELLDILLISGLFYA